MATHYTEWKTINCEIYDNMGDYCYVHARFSYCWRIRAVDETQKTYLQVYIKSCDMPTAEPGGDVGAGFRDGISVGWNSNFFNQPYSLWKPEAGSPEPGDQFDWRVYADLTDEFGSDLIAYAWRANDGSDSDAYVTNRIGPSYIKECEIPNHPTNFYPVLWKTRYYDWESEDRYTPGIFTGPFQGSQSEVIDFKYYPAAVKGGNLEWYSTDRTRAGNKMKFWIRKNSTTWRESPCYFDSTTLSDNKLHIRYNNSSWKRSFLFGKE